MLACGTPSSEAPGGGSSGPLRPHAASPSEAASAPIRARRKNRRSKKRLKKRIPCVGDTIANQAIKAKPGWIKSGFIFFQLSQPFLRLHAHVFRRRSAEAG